MTTRGETLRAHEAWILVLLLLSSCLAPGGERILPQGEAPETAPPGPRGLVPPSLDAYSVRTGGQHRLVTQATNYGRHAPVIAPNESSRSQSALRLRQWANLFHEAEASHGFYVQVEFGHVFLGEDRDFPKKSGDAPDETGVELRRGHLWVVPWDGALLRVGVVGWSDRFGDWPTFDAGLWAVDTYDSARSVLANSIWDFNPAGAVLEGRTDGGLHYRGSLLWLDQGDATLTGSGSAVLLGGDADLEHGAHSFGTSLYFLRDEGSYSYGTFGGPESAHDSSWDGWLGARGYLDFGGITPRGYVILNYGETDGPDWSHFGAAGRLAVDLKRERDVWSAQLLLATGASGDPSRDDSSEFRTIAQSERDDLGAQGYWSYLGITSPHGPSDLNDLGIGLQNRGLGLITAQLSWQRELSKSLGSRLAAGHLRSARDNPATGSSNIGIEVLGELGWRFLENMSLDVGAAYLATGDYFRGPGSGSPDDLFSLFVRMQFEL